VEARDLIRGSKPRTVADSDARTQIIRMAVFKMLFAQPTVSSFFIIMYYNTTIDQTRQSGMDDGTIFQMHERLL